MAKKYRVELKPLEPYFFAGEKSFGFGKKKKQSYNNYFIRSELFPTQTTLLGTIRYLILKKYNLLTTKDYSNEKEQEKYVGKSSFQIGQKNQSYGMIERLSPLFILNEKGERLVRVPFNQQPKSDDNLKLRSLKEKSYPIFDGSNDENNNNYEMKLLENVNLKKEDDVQKLFYNIDTDGVNKLIKQSDIVNSIEKVGINLRIEKEAFFKKEYQYLIKGYRFGFYLEINDDEFEKKLDDVIEDIVYMGSGKSAFKLVMSKTDENIKEFIDQVKEAFKMSCDDVVYYAMSDIIVDFNKIKKYEIKIADKNYLKINKKAKKGYVYASLLTPEIDYSSLQIYSSVELANLPTLLEIKSYHVENYYYDVEDIKQYITNLN